MSENNPFARVVDHWEEVIADMEATAREYREAGFYVLELHPGDVTIVNDEQYGLDILVPDDEFQELNALATEASFESYEIYRADAADMTFVLVVLEDTESERVVCCPAYYDESSTEELKRRAHENGAMYTHIRPLADDQMVTFTYEDPDLFFS